MTHVPSSERNQELGRLLGNTVAQIVEAQQRLDRYALERRQAYQETPPGQLALPPLWYLFRRVAIDIELSARIHYRDSQPRLQAAIPNRVSQAVFGRERLSNLRVALIIEPQGPLTLVPPQTTEESE